MLAALALGLVLTYRASGVVNFAHAAVGTYLAFAFFELLRQRARLHGHTHLGRQFQR